MIGSKPSQRTGAGRGPVRVVIDARMADGSGGVQQWVIGLAAAFSRLEPETEEYKFLVRDGQGSWLEPYLHGPCSLLVEPTAAQLEAAPSPTTKRRPGLRAALGRRFPILRRVRRRLTGGRRAARPSPFDRVMDLAGADVVHFPRPSASRTSLPNIYQPWDLQHLHLPEFFDPEASRTRDATYRAFCAQASLIVVATRWVKEDLARQYGIEPGRIAVVNPAPATDAYAQPTPDEQAEIAARLGLPARFAFYPAQTWGHKNHERLLDALRLLRDRGIVVPLVCSGQRNERYPALMQRAADLGVEGQVQFLGFLSPLELQVVYRSATCLVFPTLYEGWGLPIVEAFAADLPVACSNATSLPALVGDAAIVFDPESVEAIASAIERLWTDEGLRAQLAERGRSRVAEFDWDRTARTMRAHYRRLAGRRLDASDIALVNAEPLV